MKATERRRTGGHVRPAGWHGLQSFGRQTRWPCAWRQSIGRHNFELWLLRGQCRKCDIHRPTVLTKYLWEYYCTLVCARTTGVYLCMPWNLHILYLNLTDFHWLYQPIRARIQYKIALGLLTFKIYTSTHPTIRPTVLQLPPLFTMLGPGLFFSSRAFCHAAPTIWNSLPADLTDNSNGERTYAPLTTAT